ncbi:MAG TPA: nucleotide exchange factor GrpE [Actinomycetota bacterium]|nr:nucleotide exchange factor GrpE [Actinomycetota bacterium]
MPDDRPESVRSPNATPDAPEMPAEDRKAQQPEVGRPDRGPEVGTPDRGPEAPEPPSEPPRESADGGTESRAESPRDPAKDPAEEDPRIGELQRLVVHLKADFDNYRKRSQKEIASSMRMGELEAVKRILPVVSNLERALAAAGQMEGPGQALAEGVRQIHQQLVRVLASMQIERIPGVGTPFDPMLHDAVAATSNPDVPPGTVVDEFEPGWQADGKALVPAKVRVSTAE